MKGTIIIPRFYETLWTPEFKTTSVWAPIFYGIQNHFGFELKFADEVDVPIGTDVVIMFGVPYHNRQKLIPGLIDLNKNTKLIMFTGDLQCYNNKLCLDNKIKVFERCDRILSFAHEYFVKMYPQFLSKYEFMPHFFSPYERYSQFLFNDEPKMKCLLSGSVNEVYPLRLFIKRNSKGVNIQYEPPIYIRDNYAKLLHSYFCCVTSSSIFNYVLAKYFEITAAGSLLLANETEDSKKVGFVPYKHYIPITKSDVFVKIDQCIRNPNDYTDIRMAGMEFVRKNHSVINRIESFKKIFDGMFN